MKFLQKINIYLYVAALLLIIFLATPVFAVETDSPHWILTMQDYDTQLKSVSCGNNGTMYDVVIDFIDNFDDTYYNLTIGQPWNNGTWIVFYLYSKDYTNDNFYYNALSSGNRISLTYPYSSSNTRRPFFLMKDTICSNYQDNTEYQRFYTLYTTNIYESSSTSQYFYYNNYDSPSYAGDKYEDLNTTITSLDSFNTSIWFYYSTIDYKYNRTSGPGYFAKPIYITDNDTTYVVGDSIPSYYDLHHSITPSDPSFIGYSDSLKTIYTNLDSSDVSNYSLKFSFRVPQSLLGYYQTPQEYIDNTSFDYVCGGRVDHTNYYTYDTFECSLSSSYTSTDNSIEYTFNNLSTSTNLSNYDKLYVTIKSNYLDSSISKTLFDLSYNYNLGSFYLTDYKGSIYENFNNLPLNFNLYLSSNNSLTNSDLYVRKYQFLDYNIKYIGFSNISQQQNLVIGSSVLGYNENNNNDFIKTNVSNSIDTGIMIYQDNSAIVLPSLELFFNGGIVLSFNNSNTDTFYYIDNEGVISSGSFVKPIIEGTNNYDISYYINELTSFIDDLSSDSIEISYLTQTFYNGLPLFIQSFIFVLFILACVYFTYLLIKR